MNEELFPKADPPPLTFFEERLRCRGYGNIAGIDEAGRGPLAGPVVAAAVILPPVFELSGLNDSKKLSASCRDRLFPLIRAQARAIGVGIVPAEEIDRINILQATLRAMSLAVRRLKVQADYLLVDGITPVPLSLPQQTLKQGDGRCAAIAAASIVAKVLRDRIMIVCDERYPGYGLARHKGYGSAAHLAAIADLGPTPLHRKSFAGVREHLQRS
ncbi:ribonuclease HII [Trichloromonas sp.]|uniref:ribonuclease HII n=1 Tax=Trichloromonas sp. TaxID=3069249 RepID=UPI002A4DD69C|nr:ribonuclease HII [Trichloromonas sp.]